MSTLNQMIQAYTVFEDNQVLTAGQLNQRMDYLDQQTRLSRVRLHGIGIVCGLNLNLEGGRIRLSRGSAVTSQGDLLHLADDQLFGRFKLFTDPDAGYAPFRPAGALLELYELGNDTNDPLLSDFESRTAIPLAQACAVLYLESYLFDPDLCTGGDCDNLGQQQRTQLKVLLLHQDHVAQLMNSAPPFKPLFLSLDALALPRPILTGAGVEDYPDLARVYVNAITEAVTRLKTVLAQTYGDDWRLLLGDLYGNANPVTRWSAALDGLVAGLARSTSGIQYIWGHLKNIAATYQEFREALWGADEICCPDIAAFPKHVLLGRLEGAAGNAQTGLRHGFYAPPPALPQDRRLQKARFLHQRIDALIAAFAIPAATQVRVTPSRTARVALEEQALPYYYAVTDDALNSIQMCWSYTHALRRNQDAIVSYNADRYSRLPQALSPLRYGLDDADFFRIEGHLGLTVDDAENQLNTLIKTYNLPIKVIALQIETALPVLRPRPHIGLKDLKSLHYLHRRDIGRTLGNIKTFTGTVKQKVQAAADLPEKEVGDDTISYKAFINDSANELQTAVSEVGNHLKASYRNFNHANFAASYQSAVQKTAGINKRVKGIAYNTAASPYEKLVNDTKFKWLDWIDGILKKREEKSKALSIFAKFLNEAPAMAHLAGVQPGGTFILVYAARTSRVVADFCLPYWHYDLPADDEAEEEELEVTEKDDWLQLNDFAIRPSKTLILEKNIETLSKNFGDLKIDLQLQSDKLNIYSASTSKMADTFFKVQQEETAAGAGLYRDKEMGAKAALLEAQASYIEMVEGKGDAATAEERTMKAQMEKASGEIIKESMKKVAGGAKDLQPGSEEEKFIDTATRSWSKITNEEVKNDVSREMNAVAGTSGRKPILVNKINNFINK